MSRWLIRFGAFVVLAASEVKVPLPSGGQLALSTRGPSAFRIRFCAPQLAPFASPMVDPDLKDANYNSTSNKYGQGISAAFGALVVSANGTLVLLDSAGNVITTSLPIQLDRSIVLSSRDAKLYGGGAGPQTAMSMTTMESNPRVANEATFVPHYYSTDGYAALGSVNHTDPSQPSQFFARYASDGQRITWSFQGAFELFLMPAATLALGSRAYYQLIGAPRVPPRYVFGFMASKWGWLGQRDIEATLTRFRQEKYPLDVFITDFEWFTIFPDYTLPSEGTNWYHDFGYNSLLFPDPKHQLQKYHSEFAVRYGAIRKPRLGNKKLLELVRSKGWTFPNNRSRDLNFSMPEVQEWYTQQMAHYLDEGIDFWWNDEGEVDYFTFHWWNTAEISLQRSKSESKRFFSLNRAWAPGTARLGAAVWTGDISTTWEDLQRTPGMVLNWALAGAPYVSCDIGGFQGFTNPELLTRWYQVGIFLPIMRVHSTFFAVPHWPWLFGAETSKVLRSALELRYRLLPYHYSLAHRMFSNNTLWVRPLAMDFGDDSTAAEKTSQWMDGDLMVAPVLRSDSRMDTYLPKGTWFAFNSTEMYSGPKVMQGFAQIDEIPVFVRVGSVVPLAPIVQHTGALPGGPLEVQVYAGADASFELIEDDGETRSYQNGVGVRTTRFVWDQKSRALSWEVIGNTSSPQAFVDMLVKLFDAGLQGPAVSSVKKLTRSGIVHFDNYITI